MMKQIDINNIQSIGYCIKKELRDEQIKINIQKVKERFQPAHEKREDPIAVVCFAPSLNDTWEELKKFKYIMTCSGAHKFLIERGIIPTWHNDLDPREHKIKMLGEPHPDVEYLIASTIHPKYLDALKGFNVKLWHIFANEEEGGMVLPRGEWLVTGGSSVGLRCITLSRLLGFTDIHIFGMDGSFGKSGSHTAEHPNAPKEEFEVEYNGKKYRTTPSMLHCAKETLRELDQMPDVTAKFYGEGLVQDIMKNYKPIRSRKVDIAYNKPELISEEHKRLNYQLHQDNPNYGMGGAKHADTVLNLSKQLNTTDILDYGAGKMMLQKSLPFPIFNYDPAIPSISETPRPATIVICSDVLEHIEPDKLNFVLDDLKRCVKQVGYFVISTRKAVKTYANGENTHSIVQGKEWWEKKLSKFFDVATCIEKADVSELHIVVGQKKIAQPEITSIEKDGKKVSFFTPNDTTKWRAQTLYTKEPSTVWWIEQMKEGEVMFDVGANVGVYSVLAGAKGVKVYAFEPEAENFALLCKNLSLNNIEPNAYCVAISDRQVAGTLYAGQKEAGGACHTFNEPLGHDLNYREPVFTQGSLGITLDRLVEDGLPSPQHIKIDVDGLEYSVVRGADKILKNGVVSVLVEVNKNLEPHREMVSYLESIGFSYDTNQVEQATRKEGTFKGCAEYIFTKKKETPIADYVTAKIREAQLHKKPFPYLYIKDIFPKEVYEEMINNFPEKYTEIEKSRGTRGYPLRYTAELNTGIWKKIKEQLSGTLKHELLKKFKVADGSYSEDFLLIRDKPEYKISPHTDIPSKTVSALFYLPTEEKENAGTTIYKPKQKGFKCETGRHYDFKDFGKVKTMPFRPNSLFVFARTDESFHGVEQSEAERDVLLFNVKSC